MIKSVALSELALQTGGQLIGEDTLFDNVSIDTRTLVKGDLFIALKGGKFNGHHYLSQAKSAGCAAIVISDLQAASAIADKDQPLNVLLVSDTQEALGEVAKINRQAFSGYVFGITGSSGKTTTKNMLSAILNEKGSVCSTEGNFNNEVGVPLTLLKLKSEDDFAVVEMGARALGDIRYLSNYVRPNVAILLNAGSSHIDIFGSYENIVLTKGEIFEHLTEKDVPIINADDPSADTWRKQNKGKVFLSYSLVDCGAEVYASNIICHSESSSYQLNYLDKKQKIILPVPGKHNVSNSLAAATAALAIGFDLSSIAKGLSQLQTIKGRLNTLKFGKGLTVIDDSYNANLASMKVAIDVLDMCSGYKVAVLGEMAELGQKSLELHLELARYALASKVDQFYFIGPWSAQMAACFRSNAVSCKSKNEILEQIKGKNPREKTVLVKGSRVAGMDELVDMLQGWVA